MEVGKIIFVLATPDILDAIPEAQFTKELRGRGLLEKFSAASLFQQLRPMPPRATAKRLLQQTIDRNTCKYKK